jgi:hypothetical protein
LENDYLEAKISIEKTKRIQPLPKVNPFTKEQLDDLQQNWSEGNLR